MSITWIPSPAMALPMDIHQHPDCPSVFQPTLDSGDCPSSVKTGFHAVPQMPMPWISNGYPFQSTLKTGFHTVPVCLRSKTALGFHAVPVYPGTPMPWISNGYPWICRLSLVHPEDRILKIVLGLHAVPAYPGMPMPWISSQFTLKTGRCPSLSRDANANANAMKIQWVCIVPVHFTLFPRCPSLP